MPMEGCASWQVRCAVPSDFQTLYDLALRSMPFDAWTEEGLQEELVRARGVVLVAELNGSLIGYAISSWVLDEAELLQIATAPEYLRRGVASSLLCALCERLRSLDVGVIHLEVRAQGEAARAFYRAHGFRETGTRTAYYRNPDDAAVLMSLHLTA